MNYKNESDLRQMYLRSGLTDKEIAKRFDVTRKNISYYRNKFGIETLSKVRRTKLPKLENTSVGYERFRQQIDGEEHSFLHHRLLAVAEYGWDAVINNDVHHKNELKWDNRPENIEPIGKGDHAFLHSGCEITEFDKLRMDEFYADGNVTYADLGSMFDISQATAYNYVQEVQGA